MSDAPTHVPEEAGPLILDWLRDRQDEMTALLEALVRLESPSTEPATQAPVLALLAERLAVLDFHVRRVPGRRSGGQLYARPRRRVRGRPCQLLVGHCDTVWPVGTLADMPVEVADGRMRGPGTYDMKGGLAQMVFALTALEELGLRPAVTPVVLINSDEEIGSPDSRPLIRRLARRVDRALVLEPALGAEGRLKTARKGVARFTVHATGKASHAGLDPDKGASAIHEMAHVVRALVALNDPERGVSVNVGQIDGGQRPNVVAPACRAIVDARAPTLAEAERVTAAIRELEPRTPGVRLTIEGRFGRPPMERTPAGARLWHVAHQAGQALGLDLAEGMAGGGSDGNTTSRFTATLDGLGPVGGGAHATHEFVALDQMTERAALLALLLLAPALGANGGTRGA